MSLKTHSSCCFVLLKSIFYFLCLFMNVFSAPRLFFVFHKILLYHANLNNIINICYKLYYSKVKAQVPRAIWSTSFERQCDLTLKIDLRFISVFENMKLLCPDKSFRYFSFPTDICALYICFHPANSLAVLRKF